MTQNIAAVSNFFKFVVKWFDAKRIMAGAMHGARFHCFHASTPLPDTGQQAARDRFYTHPSSG